MHHVRNKFTLAFFIACMQAVNRINSSNIVFVHHLTQTYHCTSFFVALGAELGRRILFRSLLKTFYQPSFLSLKFGILHIFLSVLRRLTNTQVLIET